MILDHVDNLKLSDDDRDKFQNELRSLSYLSVGLSYLANQVGSMEREVIGRLPESSSLFIYGNAPDLQGVPQDLIACSFHWYSVSAYNYALLVGWLTQGRTYELAKRYVESVIPEVLAWRNKVGAHFARAYPKEGRHADSEADLSWSVLFPIAFEGEAFFTDPLRVTLSSGEPRKPTSARDRQLALASSDELWPHYGHESKRHEMELDAGASPPFFAVWVRFARLTCLSCSAHIASLSQD